jgi:hypothetical protein
MQQAALRIDREGPRACHLFPIRYDQHVSPLHSHKTVEPLLVKSIEDRRRTIKGPLKDHDLTEQSVMGLDNGRPTIQSNHKEFNESPQGM